jgi:hypothetical protein
MAETQDQGSTGYRFTIGAVLWESTALLFRNIVPLGLLIVLVTVITYGIGITLAAVVMTVAGGLELLSGPGTFQDRVANAGDASWAPIAAAGLIVFLFSVLSYGFLAAAMVSGAVDDLRGNKVSIGRCLATGFKVLLPVGGISIIVWLVGTVLIAIAAGLILLLIGFVALPLTIALVASVLWVAIPVATVERTGVFASFSRAGQLSKGYRWKIYFTVLIVGIIFIVVSTVLGGVVTLLSLIGGGVVPELVSYLISLLLSGWAAMTSAVGYYDLRMAKEGADIDQIAAVFD